MRKIALLLIVHAMIFQSCKSIKEDSKKAYQEGKIVFGSVEIIYTDGKTKRKGYMYMPTYRVSKYNSFPRAHLVKCSVIRGFMDRGTLDAYYEFSNNRTNDIIDRDTNKEYPDKILNICSKCKKKLNNGIENTEDFYETLDN